MLGWMYVFPFLFYLIAQGRGYYTAPLYPMLIAAGLVLWERWRASPAPNKLVSILSPSWTELAIVGVLFGALTLPLAPINSGWWDVVSEVHDVFTEQIGWHEMIATVGGIYADLPEDEKARTGILTEENDEAAALNLYGNQYGLPKAISGSDTFWLRGYGNPPPETVILVGVERSRADSWFEDCQQAGTTTNSYGIDNDLANPPDIFVCRNLRMTWPRLWDEIKHSS
jgi:hypothetical protein